MLELTRNVGESIYLGNGMVVTVTSVEGSQVRLAVEAPRSILIQRGETPQKPDVGLSGQVNCAIFLKRRVGLIF